MRQWIDLIVENAKDHLTPYNGDGLLYHGTDILGLFWILRSNRITKSIDQEHSSLIGVSLTYSEPDAWGFADRSANIFSANRNVRSPQTGAILTLDTEKLRKKYRLLHYWDDTFFQDDEKEVRVMTREIDPLSDFLVSFSLHPSDLEWFANYLQTPLGKSEDSGSTELAKELLALAHHPLLRPV